MPHYLIVYGTAVHAVRVGKGAPEQAAAEAFGVRERYALRRMTWKELSLEEVRSSLKITKATVELLGAHKLRLHSATDSDEIIARNNQVMAKEVAEIKRLWLRKWQQYEQQHGKPLTVGKPPIYFDSATDTYKTVPEVK